MWCWRVLYGNFAVLGGMWRTCTKESQRLPEFWLRVVCKRNEEARDADLIHKYIDTP